MNSSPERVLEQYSIQPITITRYGKVFKVEAAEGIFALKQMSIKEDQAERFLHTLRFFEKQQFPTVTPLLPTKTGEWCCQDNGRLYYLSPWGEGCEGKQRETDFFKTLAIFHRSTEKTVSIHEETWQENGERMRNARDQEVLELEVLADEIEKKHYFSPFEFSYLMHFPLIYELYQQSMALFDEWEKKGSERKTLRLVQCHGSPSPEHMITDPQRNYRFINLEQTAAGHPAHDIASMYQSCMEERTWEPVKAYHWIQTYDQHFPFRPGEQGLLKSKILYPASLFSFLKKARYRQLSSEPEWTLQLEQQMWLLEKMKHDIDSWPTANVDETQ